MKPLLIFILSLIAVTATAQDSSKYKIVRVFTVDSVAKKEIYLRAKMWVVKNFVSAKDVIQYDDNDYNRIFVKAIKHYERESIFTTKVWGYVYFNMDIEVKDGKCRITIYNLSHEGDGAVKMDATFGSFENEHAVFGQSRKAWTNFKQNALRDFSEMLNRFDNYIRQPYIATDW